MQRGWAWLKEGALLWRRNPALLTFLAFGYLLILLVISLFPLIGQPIASLLMPVISLGVLNGCRAVDAGRKVGPEVLLSGFKSNVPALVTIGGIYLVATLLVLLLTSLADGGALLAMMSGPVSEEAAADPALTVGLLTALALSAPVLMAYWFAPVLAGWWGLSAPKALFFSYYACLRNWRPFLAYAIGLAIFGAILPGILIGALGLLSPTLGSLAALPIPLIILPVIFTTFYTATRDVFGLPDGQPRAPDTPVDAQHGG